MNTPSMTGGNLRSGQGLRASRVAVAIAMVVSLCAGICAAQDNSAVTTTTPTSKEPIFLSNLHVTGILQNTSGTWVNSSAIEYNTDPFGKLNRNSLAVERNLIQVDVNDDLTEHDSMFLRAWGVYEPSYPWETGCFDSQGQTDCNADFYNQYGIRELWVKHRQGPLQLFVGRQIVTWGESLAFRVGDQINPQDLSWAFGFSNLEQSRLPLWMIHPILNLPKVGPFNANFAELVYIPGFDFLYTQVDYPDDSFDGLNSIAGRVNIGGEFGGRFSPRPDNRTVFLGGGPVEIAPPFLVLQFGLPPNPATPLFVIGSGNQVIPSATWGNSQIGFRMHTLVENTEITAFYLWNHDYNPVARIRNNTLIAPPASAPLAFRRIDLFYPQYQAVGVTANRPIYLPGVPAQLPIVIRAETFYKNHDAFNTLATAGTAEVHFNAINHNFTQSATTRSDTILWLFALDLDQAYAPWLTRTGNLTGNFELFDTTILSYSHFMQGAAGYFEHAYHNDVQMLGSVATSWWWGVVSPNWTTIFVPNGLTFLSFPYIQLNPPWTSAYFMKLQWIDVQGTNKVGLDGGVFKGKDILLAQFQYNFSLF